MESLGQYGPPLLRKCERMLKNTADAEDIVQSLFMDLIKKHRTDVDLPYLYRAATNRCLNFLRDKKNRSLLLEREKDHGVAQLPHRTPLDERLITLELLIGLTRKLDRKSAETLYYYYIDDMGQNEIADLMGTSRKTVGKRIKKIRLAAKKLAVMEKGISP